MGISTVDLGAPTQQQLRHRNIALFRGKMQGRLAHGIEFINVTPGTKELGCKLDLPFADGIVQWIAGWPIASLVFASLRGTAGGVASLHYLLFGTVLRGAPGHISRARRLGSNQAPTQ